MEFDKDLNDKIDHSIFLLDKYLRIEVDSEKIKNATNIKKTLDTVKTIDKDSELDYIKMQYLETFQITKTRYL